MDKKVLYECLNFIKGMTKEEFKDYVGNLKYAEYRCEAIYERLEEIEKEREALGIVI